MKKNYFVYIVTNTYNTVFYTGVTNDLRRRMFEHRNKLIAGFTSKYKVWKLIYFEVFNDINEAIVREKQLKDYRREKKLELVNIHNPQLQELAD